jgi:hypothetical protein
MKEYIQNLEKLDFQTESRYYSSVYLVEKEKESEYITQNVSPYIIIALDKAREFEADAVYFRFFDDGRPPLAQIYIYDDIMNKRTEDDYNRIHRSIWSGNEIPIYMVINKTEIKVFDSRKPVNTEEGKINTDPIDTLDILVQNDALKKYNAQLFIVN